MKLAKSLHVDPINKSRVLDAKGFVVCQCMFEAEAAQLVSELNAFDELLISCEALINAAHHEHFAARMNDEEMAAIEQIKAAIAKVKGGAA